MSVVDAPTVAPRCLRTRSRRQAGGVPRSPQEVRLMITSMPFAAALDLDVVDAADGAAAVVLPRSRSVSWNDDSFQAAFVALVADLAAGAAAASAIGSDEFPLTTDIDV